MEIRINKDIREYEQSVFLGMTLRQIGFALGGIVAAVAVFYLTYKHLGVSGGALVAGVAALPFVAFGFYQKEGKKMETLIRIWWKANVKTPKELPYQASNTYVDMVRAKANEQEKEELKAKQEEKKHDQRTFKNRAGKQPTSQRTRTKKRAGHHSDHEVLQ